MADVTPVSPLTLDLVASLAATDQFIAIVDPAGSPSLGRSPVSGLYDKVAQIDGSNVTGATWRTAISAQGFVVPAVADSLAQLNNLGVLEDSGIETSNVIVEGDSRLTDARTPTAHTHVAASITDFATAVGLLAQPVVGGATEDNVSTFDASGFVQDSGVAISDVIVEGDSRLTDARTPTSHTHVVADLTDDLVLANFAAGSPNQFLRINLAGTAIEWVSIPGGGDMLAANDLSDVADAPTARQNLGVEIGVDVQAYDAMLDELAALSSPGADRILFWDNSLANLDWLVPSANLTISGTGIDVASTVMLKADNLSGLANTGTSRTNLGVAIGTDVQAHDPFLDDIAALTDPGADRLLFWDDSAGDIVWLELGTGLSISTTTLNIDTSALVDVDFSGYTDKATPVGADTIVINDSEDTGAIKEVTFTALFAALGGGGGDVATDAIWDAAGDLAVGTGANTAARLAIGSNGTVLTSNGTTATWASPSGGGGVGDTLYLFENFH